VPQLQGLVWVDAEVIGWLLCGFVAAQTEQSCYKDDHIAGGPTAEAVKLILVQLHAGMPVIVEGAADHVAPVGLEAVAFHGLLHGDSRFYSFKQIHRLCLHNLLTISVRLPEYTGKKPIDRESTKNARNEKSPP
jgi:hypothetical protein